MRKEFKTILVGSSYDAKSDKSISSHSKNNIDVFSIRIEEDQLYRRETVYLDSLITEKSYKAVHPNDARNIVDESYVVLDETISLPDDISNYIRNSHSKACILRLAKYGLVEIHLNDDKAKRK